MENDEPERGEHIGRVLIGLLIVGFGLALLLDRVGYMDWSLDHRYWPFIVGAFGIIRVLYPERGRSRRSGAWLIYAAFYGYVSEFHVWGLEYGTSWPLMIVGLGLATIWRAVEGPRGRRAVRS